MVAPTNSTRPSHSVSLAQAYASPPTPTPPSSNTAHHTIHLRQRLSRQRPRAGPGYNSTWKLSSIFINRLVHNLKAGLRLGSPKLTLGAEKLPFERCDCGPSHASTLCTFIRLTFTEGNLCRTGFSLCPFVAGGWFLFA